MRKSILTLTSIVCLATNSFGQYGIDLIDSATNSFCSGDTNTTIKYLETYTKKYSTTLNAILVYHRLGEFYIHAKDYKTALTRLTSALTLESKTGYAFYEKDSCTLFENNKYSSAKADICVTLSNLYEKLGNNEKALESLNLADNKYLPNYGGCANGMIMYRTYLSLKYADFYLKIGDTTKAINRLLAFFMSHEYYSLQVTQKLKEYLRFRYSQKQINTEIEKAIKTLKVENRYEEGTFVKVYFFSIYGHTQRLPFEKLQKNRKYLRKNENLNLLKG